MASSEQGEKYYAVAFGHQRGVYKTWAEAQKQIVGFPQAVYKKFDNEEDAKQFVDDRTPTKVSRK
ncbi:Protein RNH-1.0 b [Aphelenchoides avenae]|nr:Protein RNH-1.0 b [Aphelenchus avenae]